MEAVDSIADRCAPGARFDFPRSSSRITMMNAKPHRLLLSAALTAVLFAGVPAFAQDAPGDDAIVAEATVPADRLADRYAELAGSPEAASALVSELRTGGDSTVVETVTTPVLDADGNPVPDADGN